MCFEVFHFLRLLLLFVKKGCVSISVYKCYDINYPYFRSNLYLCYNQGIHCPYKKLCFHLMIIKEIIVFLWCNFFQYFASYKCHVGGKCYQYGISYTLETCNNLLYSEYKGKYVDWVQLILSILPFSLFELSLDKLQK